MSSPGKLPEARSAPTFGSALWDTVRAAFAVEDIPSQQEIIDLIRQQQYPEVLRLLQAHPRLWASRDSANRSLLHWASLGGGAELVRQALVARCPADVRADDTGHTPLSWAVCRGHTSVACALLDAAADPLARGPGGATPLVAAVQHRQRDAAQLLLDRGGPVLLASCDERGRTAAHWAAHGGDPGVLELLEAHGADLQALDGIGMLPLHRAVQAGHTGAAEFLLDRGSDPTLRSVDGGDSIDIADQRHDSAMQMLLLCSLVKLLTKLPPAVAAPQAEELAAAPCAPQEALSLTPLAVGAAARVTAARGEEGTEPAQPEPWAVREGGAREELILHVDSSDSWSSLHETVLACLARAGASALEDAMACILVTDCRGTHVDVLSPLDAAPTGDRFPLFVRVVPVTGVCSDGLEAQSAASGAPATQRSSVNPNSFQAGALTRIPPELRWHVWKRALGVQDQELPGDSNYGELSQRESEWSQLIRADIGRTFTAFDPRMEQRLLHVLTAYAGCNPEVGYCQGMNVVAGTLLIALGREEDSFVCLSRLMDHAGLAGFYREGFPLLHVYLRACDELVAELIPNLHRHFASEGVEDALYLQQWFLTLFIGCLPLSAALAVLDAVVCEGLHVLLKVAVALLQSLEGLLLSMCFEEITQSFKAMHSYSGRGDGPRAVRIGQLLVRRAERVELPQHIVERLQYSHVAT